MTSPARARRNAGAPARSLPPKRTAPGAGGTRPRRRGAGGGGGGLPTPPRAPRGGPPRRFLRAPADADIIEELRRPPLDPGLFPAGRLIAQHGADHARAGADVAADHDVFQNG